MNELAREFLALSPAQRALLEKRLKQKKKQSTNTSALIPAPGMHPRANQDAYPLTIGQQRLLALEKLTPGTSRYTISYAYRLHGKVDVSILERAVGSVVERHEVLRTAYIYEQGAWRQEVHGAPDRILAVLDYSDGAYEQQWDKAVAYIEQETGNVFNLRSGLLFRAAVIKVRPDDFIFLVSIHHLVADGWSFGVLFREISRFYQARIEGEAVPLPALPIQYADYAAWQTQWIKSSAAEKQRSYWRNKFHSKPFPTIVPADREPEIERLAKGHGVFATVPEALRKSVIARAGEMKRTPYAFFLAAFKALLYRYSGQEVLTVSTPVSGRNHVETEELIGFFNNLLILVTALNNDTRFDGLVATVAKDTLESSDCQDLPFEHIASLPTMQHMPLGRTFFSFQDVSEKNLQLPGIETTSIGVGIRSADFDLSLDIEYTEAQIRVGTIYKTAFFKESTMKAFLGNYIMVLEHIAADPHIRIGDLPAFDLPEREENETTVKEQDYGTKAPVQPIGPRASTQPALTSTMALKQQEMPRIDLEEQLLRIWSEALGGIDIGLHDDLIELGVHSLMAIEVYTRMYQQVEGCTIPLSSLLEERTIARLARRISEVALHE